MLNESKLKAQISARQTFAIACSRRLIRPFPVINKADGIYIAVACFRLTLTDFAFRVLFHRFQTTFDRIKINKRNQNIPKGKAILSRGQFPQISINATVTKIQRPLEHKIARPRSKKADPAQRLTCSSHVLSHF